MMNEKKPYLIDLASDIWYRIKTILMATFALCQIGKSSDDLRQTTKNG